MKWNNSRIDPARRGRRGRDPAGFGAAMLDTTGAVDIRVGWLIAPLILIALGSSILLDKGVRVRRRRGVDAQGRPRSTSSAATRTAASGSSASACG
jgi:hypothetical protein